MHAQVPLQEVPHHHDRWRKFWTLALTLLGVAVFAGICAFWNYLETGAWWPGSVQTLQEGLRRPLSDSFLRPLSIFSHPWMMVVHSLVLGAMLFAPVAVAIRQGLVVALLLVLSTLLVGQALALALASAAGALLAARTPLRRRKPFLAVLMGLAPGIVYLLLASLAGLGNASVMPLHRWLLLVPLTGAILTALLGTAAVVAFWRVPGLRRGAVFVVLSVVLGAGVSVFDRFVGRDELEYALIAQIVRRDESLFEPVSLDRWKHLNEAEGLHAETLVNGIRSWLANKQTALVQRCDTFLHRYPDSPRAPSVLWVLAQSQTLQLDEPALAGGLVRARTRHTLRSSRQAWGRLASEHAGSPPSALAEWRLAVLALREGRGFDAEEQLQTASARLRRLRDRASQPAGEGLLPELPMMPRDAYYADILAEVEHLEWLVRQNRVLDDPEAAAALADLLSLNPYSRDYVPRLHQLLEKHAGTALAGNIRLAIAEATMDPYIRAAKLLEVAEGWMQDLDAAIEANYRLGLLILQEPTIRLMEGAQSPEAYLRFVAHDAIENPWQEFARQRLAWRQTPSPRREGSQ